jgi:hypothetical protein
MGLFRKALKDGKQIELPASGAELRQEMAKVAKEERFAAQGSSLLEKNSSALLRGVFEKEGLTWDDAKRALDPNIWTRSVEQMLQIQTLSLYSQSLQKITFVMVMRNLVVQVS